MYRIFSIAAALMVSVVSATAQTQFPTKAVEIVVPFSAGGSTDLGARVIAKALQDKWKVSVRVVNLPGGNTVPAVDDIMRSPPDGYRVLFDGLSSSSLLGVIVNTLPYKVSDRTYVTLTMQTPMILAVAANSPFKSVDDIVNAAKTNPRSLSWTSLGGTGVIDIAFRRMFLQLGVDAKQTRPVPSKGGSEAAVQTAGGHVAMGSGSYGSYSSFIPAGKVRVLGVFAAERSKLLPDVKTMKELGVPNTEAIQWNGISGPPNMPKEVVAAWHSAIDSVLKEPSVIEGLSRVGIEPYFGDGKAMAKVVEDETKVLHQVVEASTK